MLQEFRKISHGWLAWVIFALIAVVFALFGVEGLKMSSPNSETVTINGETVPRSLIKNMEKYFPQFNSERALELNTKLESLGFFVSEEQINQAIVQIPSFQENGKFSVDIYKKLMGYDPNLLFGLRKVLAIEIRKQQLADLFVSSSIITNFSTNKAYELFNESRNVEIIDVPFKNFTDKVKISESEINNYFDKNKKSFISPEKFKIEYLVFNKKDLVNNVNIPEKDIFNYYEQNKAAFTIPERREVAQIVLSENNKKDLEIILKELSKKPQEFSNLAKKYSIGIDAKKGGNIGLFQNGDMGQPELDKVVFSIKEKMQVSEPIKLDGKVYIFQLINKLPESVKPFGEVKEQLKETLQTEFINNKYIEKRDEIANKIYEIPDSIQDLAKENKFKIFRTNWLSKNNFKIEGANKNIFDLNKEKILQAVLSEDVFINGNNSELLELSDDKIMVLRISENQPSRQLSLNEVKPKISKLLKELKSKQEAQAVAEKLISDFNNGKSFKELSVKYNLQLKNYSNISWENLAKNKSEISPKLIDVIFSIGQNKIESLRDFDENIKIVNVTKVIPAEKSKATKKQLDEIKQLLTQSKYMVDNVVFWNNTFS